MLSSMLSSLAEVRSEARGVRSCESGSYIGQNIGKLVNVLTLERSNVKTLTV